MADTAEVIELLTNPQGMTIHEEMLADTGSTIFPGDLIEEANATEVAEHSSAGENAQKLFALANICTGKTIDDVYAVGETVRYGAAHSGQKMFARVAAAAPAIAFGVPLVSAGNGTLIALVAAAATSTVQRDSIVGYALEAVDNSGGGTDVRIKIRVA